jgi:hypothetical protein
MAHTPRQQAIIGASSSLIILSTLAVVLRVLATRIATGRSAVHKLWWDDGFAFLALILSYGPNIIMLIGKTESKP